MALERVVCVNRIWTIDWFSFFSLVEVCSRLFVSRHPVHKETIDISKRKCFQFE